MMVRVFRPRRVNERGISLVEVLVVAAILAVFAGVAFAIVGGIRKSVSTSTCLENLRLINTALQVYRAEWGNPQSDVGDLGRLGLPPALITFPAGEPFVGERDWYICPAPKELSHEFFPHYKAFFWQDHLVSGTKDDPTYSQLTSKYKGRTPVLYDPNHLEHGKVSLSQPRTPKLIIYLDLGGHVHSKTVTATMTRPRDVGLFELD